MAAPTRPSPQQIWQTLVQSIPKTPVLILHHKQQVKQVKALPFPDAQIEARAHQIWQKRVQSGKRGTADGDWKQAIRELKWERSLRGRISRKIGQPLEKTGQLLHLAGQADTPKDALEVIKTAISAVGLVATAAGVIGLALNYSQGQDRQLTDRFSKAVEQLGNKGDITIRLGGIYSLERIAADSAKDHWTVMEVLTAYVREHSPLPQGWSEKPFDKREKLPSVTTDIHSVLTVIGRRKMGKDPWGQRLSLGMINLQDANLGLANFQGIFLSGVNLQDAYLGWANLQGAYLWDANLQGAELISTNLQGTLLDGANLQAARLWNANLQGAVLKGTVLKEADLSTAKNLTEDQLKETYLCQTKLPDDLKHLSDRNCGKKVEQWYRDLNPKPKT